jgi:hypothetical protein
VACPVVDTVVHARTLGSGVLMGRASLDGHTFSEQGLHWPCILRTSYNKGDIISEAVLF